jgi:hypothetical protein
LWAGCSGQGTVSGAFENGIHTSDFGLPEKTNAFSCCATISFLRTVFLGGGSGDDNDDNNNIKRYIFKSYCGGEHIFIWRSGVYTE